MLKRIAIILAVSVAASGAIFLAYIEWTKWVEVRIANVDRIDLEGRKLASSARSDEDIYKAEQKYLEALDMARKINYPEGEAKILNDLGILCFERRKYAEAAEWYDKALEVKRKIGWLWSEGNSLANLGDLYSAQEQHEKAADYYEQAVKAYEKAHYPKTALQTLNQLGHAFKKSGQIARAAECFEKVLDMEAKTHDPEAKSYALGQLGYLHLFQHHHTTAVSYLFECSKASKQAGNADRKRWAMDCLGTTCKILSHHHGKIDYSRKSSNDVEKIVDLKSETQQPVISTELPHPAEDYAKAAECCLNLLQEPGNISDPEMMEIRFRERLGRISEEWAKVDPENEDLKRLRAFLERDASKHALNEQLFEAIQISDLDMVKTLLAKGTNPNAFHPHGDTALQRAASKGSLDMVKLLLDNGADLKMKTPSGRSHLEVAFTSAIGGGHEETARYFMEIEASPNSISSGRRPAIEHAAQSCSPEFVKLLLDRGAYVNRKCEPYGNTPLMTAAKAGKVETTRLLLDNGADPNAWNKHGQTALLAVTEYLSHLAHIPFADKPSEDYFQVVKLLLEKGADVNMQRTGRYSTGVTALMHCAVIRNPELVKLLLDKGANVNAKTETGSTALIMCADRGDLETLKLLLDRGADVNACLAKSGCTALSNAIEQKELSKRIQGSRGWRQLPPDSGTSQQPDPGERRFAAVTLLIKYGADVKAKTAEGLPVLGRVAFLGDARTAQLLLENGADVNARSTDHSMPLMLAVGPAARHPYEISKHFGSWTAAAAKKSDLPRVESAVKGRPVDALKVLLDNGAQVNATLPGGTTALIHAVVSGQPEMVRMLLEKAADPNAKLTDGTTALMWAAILGQTDIAKALLEKDADPGAKLNDGSTALDWAALNSRTEVVKILSERGTAGSLAAAAMSGQKYEVQRFLAEGADVNEKDNKNGRTALMECARGGDPEAARLLLDKGADPNVKDQNGWTALMEAVWKDHLDTATLLLEKGADPNSGNDSGWTALTQAAWKGQAAAVDLLIAKRADINAKDSFGRTALMRAVEMGHREVSTLLLDRGADVNAEQPGQLTAIMTATTRLDAEMVKLLRERGAKMSLAAAALLGDEQEVQRIIGKPAPDNDPSTNVSEALVIAAGQEHEGIVKILLEACPDVKAKASCSGTALLCAIEKRNTAIAKMLLDKRVLTDKADGYGRGPLHYAVSNADAQLVSLLLEKGADPNATDWRGESPLESAVEKGSIDIVKALLDGGAILQVGSRSNNLMEMARRNANKEIVELLRARFFKH